MCHGHTYSGNIISDEVVNIHDVLDAVVDVTGSDAWVKDLTVLADYADAADDAILDRLAEVKRANKADFAAWVSAREGVEIDPDAIFDVQVKRLHEYKRQLLNALYILDLYFRMKDNPGLKVREKNLLSVLLDLRYSK